MRKIQLVGLTCLAVALGAFAATVTTEGTVTTIDVPSGETYTYEPAFASSITR